MSDSEYIRFLENKVIELEEEVQHVRKHSHDSLDLFRNGLSKAIGFDVYEKGFNFTYEKIKAWRSQLEEQRKEIERLKGDGWISVEETPTPLDGSDVLLWFKEDGTCDHFTCREEYSFNLNSCNQNETEKIMKYVSHWKPVNPPTE